MEKYHGDENAIVIKFTTGSIAAPRRWPIEKFEVYQGGLFWSEEPPKAFGNVLGMLFEEKGLRRALALCAPKAIKQALADSQSPC